MDVDGVIQIIPSLKGNTRDLPQEGMTLGEHKDDSQGGPKSEDLDQPEKEFYCILRETSLSQAKIAYHVINARCVCDDPKRRLL